MTAAWRRGRHRKPGWPHPTWRGAPIDAKGSDELRRRDRGIPECGATMDSPSCSSADRRINRIALATSPRGEGPVPSGTRRRCRGSLEKKKPRSFERGFAKRRRSVARRSQSRLPQAATILRRRAAAVAPSAATPIKESAAGSGTPPGAGGFVLEAATESSLK